MRKRWIYYMGAVMSLLVLYGCGTPPKKLGTASGRPEVFIHGVDKKEVLDKLVEAKLQKGMRIQSMNDYSLVVAKPITDSFMASLLYGSRYDVTPEARIRYSLVETGGGVKVYTQVEMVTNPNSSFERISDVTMTMGQKAQAELRRLKRALEGEGHHNAVSPSQASRSLSEIPENAFVVDKPTRSGERVIEKKTKMAQDDVSPDMIGEWSYEVEKQAEKVGCARSGGASLISKGENVEVYRVDCQDRPAMIFRCTYNCEVISGH